VIYTLDAGLLATTMLFPKRVKRWFRSQQQMLRRQCNRSYFSDWRTRLEPTSRKFGFDRGSPIDRYYIESFLACHAANIRGRVLEVGDDTYARKFGGAGVGKIDILHATNENKKATIVADLTCAEIIPSETFDCIICTQTMQFIYDVSAAVCTLHRVLKPGGVLLVTFPGISQISRYDMDQWGEYWRFTTVSARRLFQSFGPDLTVKAYGNVLTAIAFLHGLAAEELRREELDYCDPDYEVLLTVRAAKSLNGHADRANSGHKESR